MNSIASRENRHGPSASKHPTFSLSLLFLFTLLYWNRQGDHAPNCRWIWGLERAQLVAATI